MRALVDIFQVHTDSQIHKKPFSIIFELQNCINYKLYTNKYMNNLYQYKLETNYNTLIIAKSS